MELVEGGSTVLKTFSPRLQTSAHRQLEARRRACSVGARVTKVDAQTLEISDASGTTAIPVATVLWAAGVRASGADSRARLPLDRGGESSWTPR